MRVLRGIRKISTIRRNPADVPVQTYLPAHVSDPSTVGPPIFDPDQWPWECSSRVSKFSIEVAEVNVAPGPEVTSSVSENGKESDTSKEGTKKKLEKEEIVEENRSDGHAPIKTAASILMHSLQKTSSMTTSLSDIDVTLFNFHSTKFAERLLNRNVSGLVLVESSHVFSKNAKKFAEKLPNVNAYRADIYTLMGVGRKKTAQFPKKMMFAGIFEEKSGESEDCENLELSSDSDEQGLDSKKAENSSKFDNIRPLKLTSSPSEEDKRKFRRPNLLAVLPTANIQRTIVDSMIQHALLHHSESDNDTIFRYGETNLMTFLGCGTLAQYTCSTDPRLHFLSHQHRRHSVLFDKLFSLHQLNTNDLSGHPPTSFHPQLPTAKKLPHEKKLAEVDLINGMQYAVRIAPKNQLTIDGKEVTSENGLGKMLIPYGCFMTQIGRQPNTKTVCNVVRALWPESALSIPADTLSNDKIGLLPIQHLEAIFTYVQEELLTTPIAISYASDLKIKRAV